MNPRERLQKSPGVKDAAALLNSPLFESLSEIALLTFVGNLSDAFTDSGTLDTARSMALQQQLVGAKKMLRTLRNLTNPAPEPKIDRSGTLDYNA